MHFMVTMEVKRSCFASLVEEQYDYFMNCFCNAQKEFADLPEEKQPGKLVQFPADVCTICFYMQYLDEFKLILCHSEGTFFKTYR